MKSFKCIEAGILLFFLGIFSVKAQENCNRTIQGYVVDADKGRGIGFATVHIKELGQSAATDKNGYFEFNNLCEQEYKIGIFQIGYGRIDTVIRPSKEQLKFYLKPDDITLQQTTIEQKRPDEEVTQTKVSLTEEELDATRGKSLGESIKEVSGVYTINTSSTASKPVIHGLHSNRILILNNGVRQVSQQWNLSFAPEIDPFIASKITVIQGANSVKYGSDAMGGVILVDAPELRYHPGLEGELNLVGFSNNKQGVISGMMGGNFKEISPLSWRVQGTLNRGGNSKTPEYYLSNTGIQENNFSLALGFRKERYGAEVYYSQYNAKIGVYRGSHIHTPRDLMKVFGGAKPDTAQFSYELGRPRQEAEHELFKTEAFFRTGQKSKLEMRFSRQFNRRQEYDVWHAYQLLESDAPQLSYKITTHNLDIGWKHRFLKRFKGDVGVSGGRIKNTITNAFYLPKYNSYFGGVYWVESWKYKKLRLEGGVRYDHQRIYVKRRSETDSIPEELIYNNFAVNTGANYEITKNLQASLNLGTAWRPPSVYELFSNGIRHGSASFIAGSANLSPEKVYSSIFNLQLNHQEKIQVFASVFYKYFDGYIFLTPADRPELTIRGIFPRYNYEQASVSMTGTDFRVNIKPVKFLDIRFRGSIIRAFNKTIDDYLILIPPDHYDVSLRFSKEKMKKIKIKKPYFQGTLQYHFKQKRVPEQGEIIPPPEGYFLLNFEGGLTVAIKNQPVVIGLSVTNALNEVYRSYLNRWRFYADEVGRNFSLRLKIPIDVDFE